MRQEDFINALCEAGWIIIGDVQHVYTKALHKKLFPVTELEETIIDLKNDVDQVNI